MWDLSRPGTKTVSPGLAGRFFTTEPPGKPRKFWFYSKCNRDPLKGQWCNPTTWHFPELCGGWSPTKTLRSKCCGWIKVTLGLKKSWWHPNASSISIKTSESYRIFPLSPTTPLNFHQGKVSQACTVFSCCWAYPISSTWRTVPPSPPVKLEHFFQSLLKSHLWCETFLNSSLPWTPLVSCYPPFDFTMYFLVSVIHI